MPAVKFWSGPGQVGTMNANCNSTKFLIDGEATVVKRLEPQVSREEIGAALPNDT